jgi:hypothetical protein
MNPCCESQRAQQLIADRWDEAGGAIRGSQQGEGSVGAFVLLQRLDAVERIERRDLARPDGMGLIDRTWEGIAFGPGRGRQGNAFRPFKPSPSTGERERW